MIQKIIFLSFLSISAGLAQTVTDLLPSTDIHAYFNQETGQNGSTNFTGAWVTQSDTNGIYVGFGGDGPYNGPTKAVLGLIREPGQLETLGILEEQGVQLLLKSGDRMFIQSEDPSGRGNGWDAGNLYYHSDAEGFVKMRNRFDELTLVTSTTSDAQGKWSIQNMRAEYNSLKFIPRAGYRITQGPTSRPLRYPNLRSGIGSVAGEHEDFDHPDGWAFSGAGFRTCHYDAAFPDVGMAPHDTPYNIQATEGSGLPGLLDGTSRVGGTIFEDTNQNGVRDEGEAPIAGVRVELLTRAPYFPSTLHAYDLSKGFKEGELFYAAQSYGADHPLFRSTDNGDSWEVASCDLFVYEMFHSRGDRFFTTLDFASWKRNFVKQLDNDTIQVADAGGSSFAWWGGAPFKREFVFYETEWNEELELTEIHGTLAVNGKTMNVRANPIPYVPASSYTWPGTTLPNPYVVAGSALFALAEDGTIWKTADLEKWSVFAQVDGSPLSISFDAASNGLIVGTKGERPGLFHIALEKGAKGKGRKNQR